MAAECLRSHISRGREKEHSVPLSDREYIGTGSLPAGGEKDMLPTLVDFYNLLIKQNEQEAQDIATCIELYAKGSFNVFAHQTNVNIFFGRLTDETEQNYIDVCAKMFPFGYYEVVPYDMYERGFRSKLAEILDTPLTADDVYTLFGSRCRLCTYRSGGCRIPVL